MKNPEKVRPNPELPIGALAEAAGVNVETIRYYQRRGLVEEPNKPLGGHRRYSASAVKRVVFIKRAQQLGFTLEEVKALLRLEDGQSCGETRTLAEHKLGRHRGAARGPQSDAAAAQDLDQRMLGWQATSLLPYYRHALCRRMSQSSC